MNAAQLINQTSTEVEYYTPQEIIEAARETMGGIDLDPASSETANQRVKAKQFFSWPSNAIYKVGEPNTFGGLKEGEDGLRHSWWGRVWKNHPFGRQESPCTVWCREEKCLKRGWHLAVKLHGNLSWITKLEHEWNDNRLIAACCITYACTSEAWFRPLLKRPQCFLVPRTNYLLPDGTVKKGVTKGSVVTYYGTETWAFARNFKHLGEVKIPYECR